MFFTMIESIQIPSSFWLLQHILWSSFQEEQQTKIKVLSDGHNKLKVQVSFPKFSY